MRNWYFSIMTALTESSWHEMYEIPTIKWWPLHKEIRYFAVFQNILYVLASCAWQVFPSKERTLELRLMGDWRKAAGDNLISSHITHMPEVPSAQSLVNLWSLFCVITLLLTQFRHCQQILIKTIRCLGIYKHTVDTVAQLWHFCLSGYYSRFVNTCCIMKK